jgi:hypothetical protein
VRRPYKFILPVLALLAATSGAAGATAEAHDATAPLARTLVTMQVAGTSAELHGMVDAGNQRTTYWFELGPTTAYGADTQSGTTDRSEPVSVQASVSGLIKGTTYHARLVARNDDGQSLGADTTFTTAGAIPTPVAPSPLPSDDDPTDADPGHGPAPASVLAPAAPPELGQSVGVAEQAGSVLVRLPGSTRAVALTADASVPVGSILDTRKGTVALSSALPGEASQTGTFHGGLFEVRQPAGAHGMTELALRGPLPTRGGGGARAAAVSAKRPPRVLWGRDDHGRFRTRGSNSVATVRGTSWYVADRCDGTLTRVTRGSVSVRDLRRQRTVLVHAGKSYLAHSAR